MIKKTKKQKNFMRKINLNFDWLYSETLGTQVLTFDVRKTAVE